MSEDLLVTLIAVHNQKRDAVVHEIPLLVPLQYAHKFVMHCAFCNASIVAFECVVQILRCCIGIVRFCSNVLTRSNADRGKSTRIDENLKAAVGRATGHPRMCSWSGSVANLIFYPGAPVSANYIW